MSGPFGSSQWMYASGGFYNGVATQSLRFDDGSSAYLDRDFTGSSPDNDKKMTISVWAKRGNLSGVTQVIISNYDGVRFLGELSWRDDDKIRFRPGGNGDGASNQYFVETSAVYRDVGAWYHIVLEYDSTQATDTNRVKLYVNGTQKTLSAGSGQSFPPLNYAHKFSYAGPNNAIGYYAGGFNSNYLDGYLSEFNFIDGIALDPTSFGQFKNSVWIPIEYTGSYGSNGYRLQFNQTGTGSASSSTIGADTSGNDNHFSSSGIVASDCDMPDSPENNWSTMNSLINGYGTNITMSEGNLAGTGTSSEYNNTLGTILMTSGKWYWEISSADFNNYDMLGIAIETAIQTTDSTPYGQTGVIAYATQGAVYNESASGTGSYTSFQASEIIGIAVDLDASPRTFKFYNNNTLQGTINLSSNFDDVGILPFFCIGNTDTIKVNFGQDSSFAGLKTAGGNTDDNDIGDFYYSPPSGYLALCTANLPEPTISPNADTQADDYFNTVEWTGNATSRSISGVGFQADWLWFKRTDASDNHHLIDSVRGLNGGTVFETLYSNLTNAEGNDVAVTAFNSDGFDMQASGNGNTSGRVYVGWSWKAGGTAVSNTDGSITSSVSANTDAGFSIVTYTGSTSESVGHGLGVAPKAIFVKDRDASASWAVYHQGVQDVTANGFLELNQTYAVQTGSNPRFLSGTAGTSQPTSTVFYVNNYSGSTTNNTGNDYIAYCFAEIEGYSKFGSYTGNGSDDGTFVYTGFRPAWLMLKRSAGGTGSWNIADSIRSPENEVDEQVQADGSASESTIFDFDFLSNGFKARTTDGARNGSGSTYIYMAFAEVPFKYSLSR